MFPLLAEEGQDLLKRRFVRQPRKEDIQLGVAGKAACREVAGSDKCASIAATQTNRHLGMKHSASVLDDLENPRPAA